MARAAKGRQKVKKNEKERTKSDDTNFGGSRICLEDPNETLHSSTTNSPNFFALPSLSHPPSLSLRINGDPLLSFSFTTTATY